MEARELTLLAAARLRIGSRRLRALARGETEAVERFVQSDSALRLAEARRDARHDGERLVALGARLIAIGDPQYPPGLLDLRDPPAFITVQGALPVGGAAVVGARDASAAACAFAERFVGELGLPVVSGLARGVDAAAHRAAVAAQIAQIAYVGTGLGRTYPPEHRELETAILASGGAIASERFPNEPVTTWALVRRDRLQAAHAAVVVLIESDLAGGAMHTLRFARECGRPRFALEGSATGNRCALAEGAVALPWNPRLAAQIVRRSAALGDSG